VGLAASVLGQSKVGTAGEQFLKVGVSARAMGMGEAFVAVANDASALFYNPGGVARLSHRELLATHTQLPAGIYHEFAGFVYPVSKSAGTWGVSFVALTMDDMKRTVPLAAGDHWDGPWFSAASYAGGITYSRSLTHKFSAGVTLKMIRDALDDKRTMGIGGDIGTLYDLGSRKTQVGMAITNFGPDMKFIKESFPLPMDFKVGFSMVPYETKLHRVTVDLEGSHPNDNEERAILGAEYAFRDLFFLRAGRKIKYDTEHWSLGVGIALPTRWVRAELNYSYTDWGWLTQVHRGTLRLVF
jgi:hypothetical protein